MATQRSGTSSSQSDEAADSTEGAAPIRIKKYANRRLYNTATSSYVTLEHLAQMVKEGQDFVVHDAKTGDEITRAVLTQIIVEEESKTGQNMLPIGFLRQLIGLYGNNMQWMVPKYLEYSLETFSENQERMRQYMQKSVPGMFPFGAIDDVSRQNVAMFEQAMKMFSPFPSSVQNPGTQNPGRQRSGSESGRDRSGSENASNAASGDQDRPTDDHADRGGDSVDDPLSDMHRRLDELQRQMEVLGQMGKTMSQSAAEHGVEKGESPDRDSDGSSHTGGKSGGKSKATSANRSSKDKGNDPG